MRSENALLQYIKDAPGDNQIYFFTDDIKTLISYLDRNKLEYDKAIP